MRERKVLKKIRDAIREYDPDLTKNLVEKALTQQISPQVIVREISNELKIIGDEYGDGKIFLVDLFGAAASVEGSMEILRQRMENAKEKVQYKGKIVIGTVEGDIHSIGKNIVASILRANGFEVIDIGEDQPVSEFINKVKELKPDIVGASALLTTTMVQQRKLVETLDKEGLRGKVKVIIGGAPITKEWCKEINADGYARDSIEAVNLVESLLKKND